MERIARAHANPGPEGSRRHHASTGGTQIVTDIVIDHDTFDRMAAQLAGWDPAPLAQAMSPFPTRGFRCSTLDGHPVEPTAAVAHALTRDIRRVVIRSDSVVIDLGRRRRLFTGPAALAVKLLHHLLLARLQCAGDRLPERPPPPLG